MMKTRLAALASALALALLMSTVWGAKPTGDLIATVPGGVMPSEVIGVTETCRDGSTPITLQFTELSPGENGPVPYSVFNEEFQGFFDVFVTITAASGGRDNSIDFETAGGSVTEIWVKAGQAHLHYDYINFAPNPDFPEDSDNELLDQTSSDGGLNNRDGGSQEVSHVDFCLSATGFPLNTSLISECVTADGCNPSGGQNNQFPAAIGGQGFDNETVTQEPVPALLTAQTLTCGINPDGSTNPFVAHDPRVANDGNLIVAEIGPLDLTTVFDFSGFTDITNGVEVPEELVGTPCIAVLKGTNSAEFVDFFEAGVPLDDWTFIVTQFNDQVADGGLFTLLPTGPVEDKDGNRDLSFIEQAVLQPDDRFLINYPEQHAGAFTFEVNSPGKTKSGRGTVYLFGMREACVSLGAPPDLTTPSAEAVAYLEAVQDCKVQHALEYVENFDRALIAAQDSGAMIESINFYNTPLNKIRNMFNNRNFKKAIRDSNQLCDRVIGTEWNVNSQNDPGNLSMRCINLSHRAGELLIAEGIIEAMIDAAP